ncbi:jg19150 [Pararge aegeria aegeria]|uniref:Jg19150 protein n=1 Tax=Pararge aegeria aegeria TaxID=348720 RepID=A0A8S4QUG3_9NEOP|nr:jg19150 [Pararge aegeria aegeria]
MLYRQLFSNKIRLFSTHDEFSTKKRIQIGHSGRPPISRPGALKQETSRLLLRRIPCNLKNGVATPTPGYDYLNTVELTTGVRSRRAPTSARDRAPTLSQNIRQGSYTCLISRLVTQWDTFPWRLVRHKTPTRRNNSSTIEPPCARTQVWSVPLLRRESPKCIAHTYMALPLQSEVGLPHAWFLALKSPRTRVHPALCRRTASLTELRKSSNSASVWLGEKYTPTMVYGVCRGGVPGLWLRDLLSRVGRCEPALLVETTTTEPRMSPTQPAADYSSRS